MQEIPQHSKNTHMIGFISQTVFCILLKGKVYFWPLDIDFHPALVYYN